MSAAVAVADGGAQHSSAHTSAHAQVPALRLESIGDYAFERTVGQGQFGKVKLAVHRRTGIRVAVKMINKTTLTPDTLRMVQREVTIMKMLHHPHIIQLYEVVESDTHLFIAMEYAAGGEVMDLIMAHGRLREREACRFFSQAALALQYCHSRHCVHRDVKAENLLLDDQMNIKLIDFGLSNVFTPGSTLKTFCGSPTYASPELVQRHAYTGPEVDCWSLGVLLYVLVCGELPFDGSTFLELYRKIIDARYRPPLHVSPLCRDLISRMLVPDPKVRLTIDQICSHPWITSEGGVSPAELHLSAHVRDPGDIDQVVLTEMTQRMGYSADQVLRSVCSDLYDDTAATYFLLLGSRSRPVLTSGSAPSFTLGQIAQMMPSGSIPSTPTGTKTQLATPHTAGGHLAPPSTSHRMATPDVAAMGRNRSATHADGSVDIAASAPPTPDTYSPSHSPSPMAPSPAADSPSKQDRPKGKTRAASAQPKYATMKTPKVSGGLLASATKTLRRKHGAASPTTASPPAEESGEERTPRPSIELTRPEEDWVIVDALPAHDLSADQRAHYDGASRKSESKRHSHRSKDKKEKDKDKEKPKEPRSVRFAFSVHMTSTKTAPEMMEAIRGVLGASAPPIEYSTEHEYLLKCSDRRLRVQFEVEVCRLPHLSVNGVRFHRLRGDSWRYKNLCKELLSQLHI